MHGENSLADQICSRIWPIQKIWLELSELDQFDFSSVCVLKVSTVFFVYLPLTSLTLH